MAVVDIKGTLKDFCSVTCLASFKSNTASTQTPQSLCSMCNKSCTVSKNCSYCPQVQTNKNCLSYSSLPNHRLPQATCDLTLNDAVRKFCSESCMEGFCKDVCEICNSHCRNKLLLKLEEGTKTICSDKCLENLKEVQK